jgi:hypothetical protein
MPRRGSTENEKVRWKAPGERLLPQIAALFGVVEEDPTLPSWDTDFLSFDLMDPRNSLSILFQSLEHFEVANTKVNAPKVIRLTELKKRVLPVVNRVVEEYLLTTGRNQKDLQDIPVVELKPLLLAADPEIGEALGEIHGLVSELLLTNRRLIGTVLSKFQELSDAERLELTLASFQWAMKRLYSLDASKSTALSTYLVTSLRGDLDRVRHIHGEGYPMDLVDTNTYRAFNKARTYFEEKNLGGQSVSEWAIAGVFHFHWHEDEYGKFEAFFQKLPALYQERLSLDEMVNLRAWLAYWHRETIDRFFEPTLAGQDIANLNELASQVREDKPGLIVKTRKRFFEVFEKPTKYQQLAFSQLREQGVEPITVQMIEIATEMLIAQARAYQTWLADALPNVHNGEVTEEISAELVEWSLGRSHETPVHQRISLKMIQFDNLTNLKSGDYFGQTRPVIGEDGVTFHVTLEEWVDYWIADPDQPNPENIPVVPLKEVLKMALNAANLNDREILLLTLKYGLENEDSQPVSMFDLSERFGVTETRILQIEARALLKLRFYNFSRWGWSVAALIEDHLDYLDENT